jgi:hypothetical protein
MRNRIRTRAGFGAMLVLSTLPLGCGEGLDDAGEMPIADEGKEDSATSTLTLAPGRSTQFTFKSTGATVSLKVDCSPPADPDTLGPVFAVTAPGLGIARSTSQPPRAGFWRWIGKPPSGTQTVTLGNRGAQASCRVTVSRPSSSAACATRTEYRSPNTNHTHLRVGTDPASGWEAFPTSGNHWGAWAKWNVVYQKPVLRAFLLHNLEHGGAVLSYKCVSPTQSAACKDAQDKLIALANAFGRGRVIVTPDSTQPTLFAVRTWRWAYQSDCLDAASAKTFLNAHHRHGREDEDSDPPIPFNPTTKNVPCEDLMAAPDSCN